MACTLILMAALILAACTGDGVLRYDVDCAQTETGGYDCAHAAVEPYQTPTPYPPTTGKITLGETFDDYLSPDTQIQWRIVQAPGQMHLTTFHRAVVVAMTQPGDYVIEASWTHGGIAYSFPYTITVSQP